VLLRTTFCIMTVVYITSILDYVIASASSAVSLVIIAVFMYDKALRQLPSNAFLINFVVTNLLVASASFQIASTKTSIIVEEKPIFLMNVSCFIVSVVSYTLSLSLITLDRYWAIVKPFDYATNMNWPTAKRILYVFWFSVSVFGIVTLVVASLLYDERKLISAILVILMYLIALLCLFLLIFVNSIIIREVRRQVNRLVFSSLEKSTVCLQLARREKRTTYLCFGVVATFLFCWLPKCVCVIFVFAPLRFKNLNYLIHVSTTLYFMSLIINPFWYIFWKADFRQSLRRLLIRMLGCCGKRCCVTQPNNVMSMNDISSK